MNPIVAATLATAFFALGNVILEQKLAQVDKFTFIMGWTGIAFVWAFVTKFAFSMASAHSGAIMEIDSALVVWFLLMGSLYFCGNYLVITAFAGGGHVVLIAAVALVGPAFTAAFRLLWVMELPNKYIVIGYLLCAAGVAVMMCGSQSQNN